MSQAWPGPDPGPFDAEVVRAAAEAYVWAQPVLAGCRELWWAAPGAALPGDPAFRHERRPPRPGDGSRWADPTVLTSSAWLDLRAEPVLLGHGDLPPGRYAGLQVVDLFARTVAHLGSAATGTDAAAWAVTAPGWTGRLPPDLDGVLTAATGAVRVVGRVRVPPDGDVEAAHAVQDGFWVRPLHSLGGRRPPPPAPPAHWLPWDEEHARGGGFVDYLALLARAYRPESTEDGALLDRCTALGLLPAPLDARTRRLVARGAALGAAQIRDAAGRAGEPADLPEPLRRALAAAGEAHPAEPEEVRVLRWRSLHGEPLRGHHRYRLVLPAGAPPARLSWSLAAYSEPTGGLAGDPVRGDALAAAPAADGSVAVAVQRDRPADPRVAWLPSPPGDLSLALRLYAPDPGAWTPPVLRVTA
jgi:hypothetical protein